MADSKEGTLPKYVENSTYAAGVVVLHKSCSKGVGQEQQAAAAGREWPALRDCRDQAPYRVCRTCAAIRRQRGHCQGVHVPLVCNESVNSFRKRKYML